jgi:hypothetical protein
MKGSCIASARFIEVLPEESVPWNRPDGNSVTITTIKELTAALILFGPVNL